MVEIPASSSDIDKPPAADASGQLERRGKVGQLIAELWMKALNFRELVPSLALIVSIAAVVISGLSYYKSSPDIVRKTRIDGAIRGVLYRTIIVWEQTLTLVEAQAKKFSVDPYIFPALKENTRLLLGAMDSAVEAGGLNVLLGADRHNLDLYVAFVQSLQAETNLRDDGGIPLADWTKEHFLMGLIRQLDNLIDYPSSGISPSLVKRLKAEIEPARALSHSYITTQKHEQ